MVKRVCSQCFYCSANSFVVHAPQLTLSVYWKYPIASFGVSIVAMEVAAASVQVKMDCCGQFRLEYLVSHSIDRFSAPQRKIGACSFQKRKKSAERHEGCGMTIRWKIPCRLLWERELMNCKTWRGTKEKLRRVSCTYFARRGVNLRLSNPLLLSTLFLSEGSSRSCCAFHDSSMFSLSMALLIL